MATLTTLNAASPLDASDNSYLTFSNDSDQTLSRAVDNTDANFVSMTTLTWQVEYSLVSAHGGDTYGLSIRIVNGGTILAALNSGGTAQTVSSNVTNSIDATSAATAFTYVNTSATQSDWDGASVELTQAHSRQSGFDGNAIRVDQVVFNGTYVASTATITGTGAISAPLATISATGKREITATGAITTSAPLTVATATRDVTASGAIIAAPVTTSATGAVAASGITGTGAISAPTVTSTATAAREITATGAINSTVAATTGSGASVVAITSAGAIVTPLVATEGVAILGAVWVAAQDVANAWADVEGSNTWAAVTDNSDTWAA